MRLLSDQIVATRCRTQPRWFSVLYRRYIKKIFGFIRVRVNTVEDAEDLTSQVFTKALQGISQYDAQQSFETWLFAIARHTLIDFWRTQRTTIDIATVDYQLATQPVDIDIKLLTEKMLQGLSGEERYLLSLRFQDGYSYQQIAELTGREANALMVQWHRIKQKLQHLYER